VNAKSIETDPIDFTLISFFKLFDNYIKLMAAFFLFVAIIHGLLSWKVFIEKPVPTFEQLHITEGEVIIGKPVNYGKTGLFYPLGLNAHGKEIYFNWWQVGHPEYKYLGKNAKVWADNNSYFYQLEVDGNTISKYDQQAALYKKEQNFSQLIVLVMLVLTSLFFYIAQLVEPPKLNSQKINRGSLD
jgi:hypothetical protein